MVVMKSLPLFSSQNCCVSSSVGFHPIKPNRVSYNGVVVVRAKKEENVENGEEETEKKKSKQSLFTSLTDALDFAQVRSSQDAELLEEAREATKSGGKMSREQEQM
ncbi:hypothetical protein QJS10_CPB21g01563 [Acorus calamus]|uniref:Uncharacterized protein n=1 Tax=Acorus calamus TaxID=4465 RepID=A0AAV9C4W7_ACOCL|nr:hypothetical protein QJS10_CPB21g01563 [Acorus calamus]